MSKLLKHLGLGYGSSKKSESFDFRAKTLPAPTSDSRGVRVLSETLKSSGKRNTGSQTVDCDDSGSSRNVNLTASQRVSHEAFLTVPSRGLSARRQPPDADTNSRKPLRSAVSLTGHRESDVTRDKRRSSSDTGTKDLRRSVTADEISPAPAVCILL